MASTSADHNRRHASSVAAVRKCGRKALTLCTAPAKLSSSGRTPACTAASAMRVRNALYASRCPQLSLRTSAGDTCRGVPLEWCFLQSDPYPLFLPVQRLTLVELLQEADDV